VKDKRFYVYEYTRLDTNMVFYIGKGKGNRYKSLSGRNYYFLNIIKSTPYKVEIILDNLSEEEAYFEERKKIVYLKTTGQCCANLNDGGTGGLNPSIETREKQRNAKLGKILSEEHKKKISISNQGKVMPRAGVESSRLQRLGRKHTEESRVKISKSLTGKVSPKAYKIINTLTSEVFDNYTQAADSINMKPRTLRAQLDGQNKNKTIFIRHTGGDLSL